MARAKLPPIQPFVPPPPPKGTTFYGWPAGLAWPYYDFAFVRRELERYERDESEIYDGLCSVGEVAVEYRNGFMITFRWFLGLDNSPILDEPGPPTTEEAYHAELRWARNMIEDDGRISFGTPVEDVYGGFNPHYVMAVYRTLRWVVAVPGDREFMEDPLIFI